jgi:hypothetical protein
MGSPLSKYKGGRKDYKSLPITGIEPKRSGLQSSHYTAQPGKALLEGDGIIIYKQTKKSALKIENMK